MNNDRRKLIDAAISDLEQIKADMQGMLDDEQETFDNMPESLQGGEKGEKVQGAIDALEEAVNNMDSALDNLSTAKE